MTNKQIWCHNLSNNVKEGSFKSNGMESDEAPREHSIQRYDVGAEVQRYVNREHFRDTLAKNGLWEQISVTRVTSDYLWRLWYLTEYHIPKRSWLNFKKHKLRDSGATLAFEPSLYRFYSSRPTTLVMAYSIVKTYQEAGLMALKFEVDLVVIIHSLMVYKTNSERKAEKNMSKSDLEALKIQDEYDKTKESMYEASFHLIKSRNLMKEEIDMTEADIDSWKHNHEKHARETMYDQVEYHEKMIELHALHSKSLIEILMTLRSKYHLHSSDLFSALDECYGNDTSKLSCMFVGDDRFVLDIRFHMSGDLNDFLPYPGAAATTRLVPFARVKSGQEDKDPIIYIG